MSRIDVVLHPDAVSDLRTVTELAQSALDARGVSGQVLVAEDSSVAAGDAVVVPASGGRVDTRGEGRCVVRVDYGLVPPDRSPDLFGHIRGRGLGGLRYAVDKIYHHRLHPATVVTYGEHWEQRIEVRRAPTSSGSAIALLHGGYWRAPWKLDSLDAAAIDLARRGYDTWNIEYRSPDEYDWATTTSDIAAAVGSVDADTVAVMGHSAGGQLALRYAADSTPALAVSLAGVIDLQVADDRRLGDGAVAHALGAPYSEKFASSSPRARLPLGVPQIVACATEDDPNLNDIGRAYVAAAQRSGDDATLVEGPGGHFAVVDPTSAVWADLVEAIDLRLSRSA